MAIEVTSPGRLNGTAALPGDHALTLSVIALGMLTRRMVTIVHPAPARDVERLLRFILDCGGERREDVDGFTFRCVGFRGTVEIPAEIPADVFHIIVAGAVFSAEWVIIENTGGARDVLFAELLPVLRAFGLRDGAVSSGGGQILIKGTSAVVPERLVVGSPWEMEAVSAVCLAGGVSPCFSCGRQEVSPVFALLDGLGLTVIAEQPVAGTDALARRMAKLTGGKSPEWFRLAGEPVDCEIRIPGDTLVAGAVAALAAVLPRSEVVLRDVLWEPGRRGFFETLRRMRGVVEWEPGRGYSFDAADVRVAGSVLEGVQTTPAQARTMRSELMVLAAAAALARGETIVRDSSPGRGFGRGPFKLMGDGIRILGGHAGDYEDGVVLKGVGEMRGGSPGAGGYPEVAIALAVAGMAARGQTVVHGADPDSWPLDAFLRIAGSLACGEGKLAF